MASGSVPSVPQPQQQVSLHLTNVGAGRAEQQEERSEAVNRAKDFFLFAACAQLQSVPLHQQQALLCRLRGSRGCALCR